jgi:hypothetical protein
MTTLPPGVRNHSLEAGHDAVMHLHPALRGP